MLAASLTLLQLGQSLDVGSLGALELGPGVFRVKGTLRVSHPGIVLRGTKVDDERESLTVLLATGKKARDLIKVGSAICTSNNLKCLRKTPVSGSARTILGDVVPVGATVLRVSDTSPYKVGDHVMVYKPGTRQVGCLEGWII